MRALVRSGFSMTGTCAATVDSAATAWRLAAHSGLAGRSLGLEWLAGEGDGCTCASFAGGICAWAHEGVLQQQAHMQLCGAASAWQWCATASTHLLVLGCACAFLWDGPPQATSHPFKRQQQGAHDAYTRSRSVHACVSTILFHALSMLALDGEVNDLGRLWALACCRRSGAGAKRCAARQPSDNLCSSQECQ